MLIRERHRNATEVEKHMWNINTTYWFLFLFLLYFVPGILIAHAQDICAALLDITI